MTVYITMGIPKAQCPVNWTQEADEMWEVLTRQISEIKARGNIVEIPHD